MGDAVLRCPLCCDRTFETKPELIEHLAIISESITCPICSNKWSSVALLIEHLTLDNCQAEITGQAITFDINTNLKNEQPIESIDQNSENAQLIQISQEPQKESSNLLPATDNENIDDGTDTSKMYVEFLSKQLAKPCLQTQEVKLVKDEGGTSRYVFVVNDDNAELDAGSAVVTKQNNDGTISLTTVRDMKIETSDPIMVQEPEESSEEIYSCNTCGVSFTSVLEHIQNYHNDQDVVVEEPLEEMDTEATESVEFQNNMTDPLGNEDTSVDKQASRRMITDTGAIIEAPVMYKTTSVTLDPTVEPGARTPEPVFIKEEARPVRRYVVVDSVVREIKRTDNKSGPYHKVVLKEMIRANGERFKIFNCMSCNIYVSSLDDFKQHPCKQLKYPCPHCPVAYENSKSLCAHMKVHKTKTGAVPGCRTMFSCEICNTLFNTNKSLKLHKRMHDPIKSRPIDPPVESQNGEEVSNDKFLCSICDKLIPIDYRAVHQQSHKVKPDLNCEICNKEFLSEEYLEMHMNVHLSDKPPPVRQDSRSLPYTCLYCDRRFSRPHEKVKHERIHTGEKPHSCEICGKSFRVSYCLTLHLRTHTGARPYSCQHCGKRFKAHSVYNHHLLTHSEVRAYKCPYCPKAFKTSVQLAGHKNSHTKPFSCQQCNRPFASLYAVRVHTETHARQNSLKFSCTLCGASYARAFALKDHIKVVHKKENDKVELDKTLQSMLAKENALTARTDDKTESWEIQNEDDDAAEEITIDTKNLPHEVDVTSPIINSNLLVVP